MAYQLDPPLAPRQGGVLDVLGICRISTLHQDVRSLDDQEALIRRYVSDHYNGPVSFHCLKAQESGEHLERVQLNRQ